MPHLPASVCGIDDSNQFHSKCFSGSSSGWTLVVALFFTGFIWLKSISYPYRACRFSKRINVPKLSFVAPQWKNIGIIFESNCESFKSSSNINILNTKIIFSFTVIATFLDITILDFLFWVSNRFPLRIRRFFKGLARNIKSIPNCLQWIRSVSCYLSIC